MSKLSQRLEFARHVPVEQLIARVISRAKSRWAPFGHQTAVRPNGSTLHPLPKLRDFSSPMDRLERIRDGWVATFLNHTVQMPDEVDWSALQDDVTRQLWRMHLHYFNYVSRTDLAEQLIGNWIETVRPFARRTTSDAWTPYATSARIVNWVRWFGARSEPLDRAFVEQFASSLHEQASFVATHLERDVRGNHLIKNIVALVVAAEAVDHPDAAKWRRIALRHLSREIDTQILPDGVHFERSPSYHMQVLGDLLQIRACLSVAGLDAAIARMSDAARHLVHPDGQVALFNDAGLHMAPVPVETVERAGHICLPDGGYYGYRDRGDYVLADMGRLGPDALMAHAHADCGSFEWSVAGQRVIVDQGVYEYVAGQRRDFARSARSHNVLSLQEADQADFFGAFRCGRRPNVTDVSYQRTSGGFTLRGTHDGYGAALTRTIAYDRSGLRIVDEFGGGRVCALLHPAVQVKQSGAQMVLRGAGFEILVGGSADLQLEPAEYWPDLGVALPTQRVVMPIPAGATRAELRFTKRATP